MSAARLLAWPMRSNQLAEVSAGFGDELVAGVAQIVEINAVQAGGG
jgi:hypothetical protein